MNSFKTISNNFSNFIKNVPPPTREQFHYMCSIIKSNLQNCNVLNPERRKIAINVIEEIADNSIYNKKVTFDLEDLNVTIEILGELKKLTTDFEMVKQEIDEMVQFLKWWVKGNEMHLKTNKF